MGLISAQEVIEQRPNTNQVGEGLIVVHENQFGPLANPSEELTDPTHPPGFEPKDLNPTQGSSSDSPLPPPPGLETKCHINKSLTHVSQSESLSSNTRPENWGNQDFYRDMRSEEDSRPISWESANDRGKISQMKTERGWRGKAKGGKKCQNTQAMFQGSEKAQSQGMALNSLTDFSSRDFIKAATKIWNFGKKTGVMGKGNDREIIARMADMERRDREAREGCRNHLGEQLVPK